MKTEVIGNATLIQGDALEWLTLPMVERVHAVITDPPYSSGAHESARRNKRLAITPGSVTPRDVIQGDVMGTFGFTWFLRMWFRMFIEQLHPGGHLACFIDWRMYPLMSAMADAAGLRANNMLVWDKGYPGLGTGFRAQHELIMLSSLGAPKWHSYKYGNVLQDTRLTSTDHPHQKPLNVSQAIVETCSPDDGLVLDTFMGSGTTGVACMNLGRKFIGIEIEPKYFDIACKRIDQAQRQQRMFA